jgi:hypothetical protein
MNNWEFLLFGIFIWGLVVPVAPGGWDFKQTSLVLRNLFVVLTNNI